MRSLLPLLLVLSACGYPKATFVKERNAALCDLYVDCFGLYADVDACASAQRRDPERPCHGYEPATAALCVSQLKQAAKDCPTTDVNAWQVPPRCADACTYPVWDTDL